MRTNLDITDDKPEKSLRFLRVVETIKKLSENNKVVILSHYGRPRGFNSKLSLKKFQLPLERALKTKVVFISINRINKASGIIQKSKLCSIFLLENLRFNSNETTNDLAFAKILASLGDRYINDDFPTAHHINASNVGITKFISSSAGPNLKKEACTLNRLIKKPQKPFVLIIGGVKMEDKVAVIRNLLPKADYVLLGGGPANTFLKAKGEKIGQSLFDKEMVSEVKKLLNNRKMLIPVDSRKSNGTILDIGPVTSRKYSQIIKNARTIVWGGPMGFFEKARFSHGTKSVWKAVLKNKRATVIVGGGETVASLKLLKADEANKLMKLRSNVFISTGGGAMLEFLAGKKLPALVALKLQRK